MKAHTLLWIDGKGRLCDAPPTAGIKIAAFVGDTIPEYIVKRHDLEVQGGKVVQKGHEALTPKSTPDALIADRTLYVNNDGELVESAPAHGIKLADEGEVIATFYVVQHHLGIKDGKVVQKQKPKPDNKAVETSPDKRRGLTINKDGA